MLNRKRYSIVSAQLEDANYVKEKYNKQRELCKIKIPMEYQ